jgi:hypothetical protein
MKNTLSDLNNYLFEALERITDDELTPDELDRELNRSEKIVEVAEAVIKNGELALKAIKHADEYGLERKNLPALLTGGN